MSELVFHDEEEDRKLEEEIFRRRALGQSYPEIAKALGITMMKARNWGNRIKGINHPRPSWDHGRKN